MSVPQDNPDFGRRRSDRDPALARALEQLRGASDSYHAQIALNIIKIIVEHQVEELGEGETLQKLKNPEDIAHFLACGASAQDRQRRRRWYDVHETLSSALQLLADTPEDLQYRLIPSIARMIEHTLEAV